MTINQKQNNIIKAKCVVKIAHDTTFRDYIPINTLPRILKILNNLRQNQNVTEYALLEGELSASDAIILLGAVRVANTTVNESIDGEHISIIIDFRIKS